MNENEKSGIKQTNDSKIDKVSGGENKYVGDVSCKKVDFKKLKGFEYKCDNCGYIYDDFEGYESSSAYKYLTGDMEKGYCPRCGFGTLLYTGRIFFPTEEFTKW